jgi:hypothetical protein
MLQDRWCVRYKWHSLAATTVMIHVITEMEATFTFIIQWHSSPLRNAHFNRNDKKCPLFVTGLQSVHFVRFEFFTAVTKKNAAFWDVKPCGSWKNRRFGGKCLKLVLPVTANVPSWLFFSTWWWRRHVSLKRRFFKKPYGLYPRIRHSFRFILFTSAKVGCNFLRQRVDVKKQENYDSIMYKAASACCPIRHLTILWDLRVKA